VDDLQELKAAKNALVVLREPVENGYQFHHKLVAMP
jgi:hypothetical protein